MLQLNNLEMVHLKDLAELIKDLNVVINEGDKVAIVGDEGTGKSTLLKHLNNDETIFHYVSIKGEKVNHFHKSGYLPQILPTALENISVQDYIYADEDPAMMRYDLLYKAVGELNFPEEKLASTQTLATLSGGEKVKIQLIKLLMQDPDLLLLDEPTNDLDLNTVEWMENFIKDSPLTIVYVSHDEKLLEQTATKVIHLELLHHRKVPRSTVANLPYREYIEQRANKFEHQTAVAKKQREEHQKKLEKHRQIEQQVHSDQQNTKNDVAGRLLKKKMASVKATGKRFERESEDFEALPVTADPILIKFSNVKPYVANKTLIHWHDKKIALKNNKKLSAVNLHIKTGEKIGIIGQNGVGKSTMLFEIRQELAARDDIEVGYMPQNYTENMDLKQTPVEFMTVTGDQEEKTKIMTYLGSLRYTAEEMNHSIRQLSGGQLAKLWLAKLDLIGANVLLLDEPTRNFSPLSQPELLALFDNFTGTIISISHDRQFLEQVCHTIYELTPDSLKYI